MIYTLTLNPALDRELTVPTFSFDTVLRASETRLDCGGKGFNVSRVLAVLGTDSVALGFSGGQTGEALRQKLNALRIETDFISITGETRTNISIVAASGEHHLKVNEAGPFISPQEQAELLTKVEKLAKAGDWWVLAGSLPPGIPATFYAEIIQRLKAAGSHTILDTSEAPLRYGLAALPTLIKPNAVEFTQLTSQPIASLAQAYSVATTLKDIEYVVISMGKAGVVMVNKKQSWFGLPPTIQEQNPIGAGDSLVAGLVWGLSKGDVKAALRYGVACGAATASHKGTGIGSYDEISRLVEQVQIEPADY
jgi:1-phosphofructokinase family hexose kinase